MLDRVRPCNQMQEALAGKANVSAVEGLLHGLEEQLQQQRNRYQEDLSGQLNKLRDDLRSKVAHPEVSEQGLLPVGRARCSVSSLPQ